MNRPNTTKRRNFATTPDVGAIPGLYEEDGGAGERTAPDGRPWLKCCDECQFRDRPTIKHVEAVCAERGAAFYCVHRESVGGHFRVCAGFAARDRRAIITEPAP